MNFNIATKQVITRRHCTSVPTPTHIINKIEIQAKADHMLIEINFKLNDLNDNLWLAGVEYNDENNINKFHQSQDENQEMGKDEENQEMDINNIH